jgi:cell division protein FtsB
VSTATARVRAAQPAPAHDRPALRLIPGRAAIAGRAPFAILVGAILGSGLIALLLLHTMAAQDAFRLHDLQRQAAELRDTQQQLEVSAQQLQSPATLAARARRLGMVPTGSISFVRLRSGRLVGVAKAAPAPAPPAPAPSASSSTTKQTTGASSGSTARHPAGCSHAHCRASAPSR